MMEKVVVFLSVLSLSSAAKILLLPGAHTNHIEFFSVAGKVLQDAGHQVSVLVPEKHSNPVRDIGVSVITYGLSPEADPVELAGTQFANSLHRGPFGIISMFSSLKGTIGQMCDELLDNKKVMDQIGSIGFDLALVDSVPFMACLYVIPYKFGIEYASLGPFMSPWLAGVSAVPAHEPPLMLTPERAPNLHNRAKATIIETVMEFLAHNFFISNNLVTTHAQTKPTKTINKLVQGSSMFFITLETTCFDFPRVSAPNYKFIGPLIHNSQPEFLPKDVASFVKSSNFILVCFGTEEASLDAVGPHLNKITSALAGAEEKVLLHFPKGRITSKLPNNFLVVEKMKLDDVLSHENIKLLITHGGMTEHFTAVKYGNI